MSLSHRLQRWRLQAVLMWLGMWGDGRRVRRALRVWLEAHPQDTVYRATLAHWLAREGLWTEAHQALSQCVEETSEQAALWFNLGFVCGRLARDAEAEQAFRRAVALEPGLDRAWYGLGLSLIAQDRLVEARPALEANTRLQPMSPHGWYQLARVHNDLGAAQEARRIIHRLQQFEPKVAAQLERETGLTGAAA